jgi:hypothetical protein
MHPEQLTEKQPETTTPVKPGNRPVICSIILAMALTYFLIMTLMFFAALVYSKEIIRATGHYYSPEDFDESGIVGFILAGTFLFMLSSSGIVLMLLKRRTGFYLFIAAVLAIFITDLVLLDFDWLRYLILSGFIFLLGILHFSKKCYK